MRRPNAPSVSIDTHRRARPVKTSTEANRPRGGAMSGCCRYRRWLGSILGASCAVALIVVPGIANAGDADEANDEQAIIAEAVEHQHKFVAAFNARNWDDVG